MRWSLSVVLVAALLLAAPVLPAQAPDKGPDQLRTLSRDELDMIKVLNTQERAWNQANIESWAIALSDLEDRLLRLAREQI